MKTLMSILFVAVSGMIFMSCDNADSRYVDLTTGEKVELVKDEQTGLWVNAETKQPVRIYVDTKTKDTIWGKTGVVINGKVNKNDGGTWVYVDADNDGDRKVKTDDDGDYKVKDGDYKKKVDNDGDIDIVCADRSGLFLCENLSDNPANNPHGTLGRVIVETPFVDHQHLNVKSFNEDQPLIDSPEDWAMRRQQILSGMERVMGSLPDCGQRVPLDVRIESEVDTGKYIRKRISFAAEPGDRVPADQ